MLQKETPDTVQRMRMKRYRVWYFHSFQRDKSIVVERGALNMPLSVLGEE